MSDDVNNPGPDPANDSGGSPPLLSQLYDTLGGVQAGLDVRQQEAEEDKKRLLEQEQALIKERDAAAEADDAEAFAAATKELEELWEAYGALTADEEPDAQPEPADSDRDGHQRDSGGDDRSAPEPGSAVADQVGGGEPQRGPSIGDAPHDQH